MATSAPILDGLGNDITADATKFAAKGDKLYTVKGKSGFFTVKELKDNNLAPGSAGVSPIDIPVTNDPAAKEAASSAGNLHAAKPEQVQNPVKAPAKPVNPDANDLHVQRNPGATDKPAKPVNPDANDLHVQRHPANTDAEPEVAPEEEEVPAGAEKMGNDEWREIKRVNDRGTVLIHVLAPRSRTDIQEINGQRVALYVSPYEHKKAKSRGMWTMVYKVV